jgi:hypothetical protein
VNADVQIGSRTQATGGAKISFGIIPIRVSNATLKEQKTSVSFRRKRSFDQTNAGDFDRQLSATSGHDEKLITRQGGATRKSRNSFNEFPTHSLE